LRGADDDPVPPSFTQYLNNWPPMSNELLPLDQRKFRGMDNNSLLRMYDLANEFFNKSGQRDRDRASKAIQRIAKELKRRNVRP